MSQERSGAGAGFVLFAAIMMVLIGIFHAIAGLTGIIKNTFYLVSPNYVISWDATVWGWIHLLLGIIVVLAGFALMQGATWARIVGIILVGLSAIANFAFIPYYPVWSILIVALDVVVLWALIAHGRDLAQ